LSQFAVGVETTIINNINVIWSAASHVKRSGVHTLIWTETIHSAPQCRKHNDVLWNSHQYCK